MTPVERLKEWRVGTLLTPLIVTAVLLAFSSRPQPEGKVFGAEIERAADELLSKGEFETDSLVVKYKTDVPLETQEPIEQEEGSTKPLKQNVATQPVANLDVEPKVKEVVADPEHLETQLKSLLANPEVESVQPNYIYRTSTWDTGVGVATPSDYNSSQHWYYEQADLPEAWSLLACPSGSLCGGDDEVTVAVIDTGVSIENYTDTVAGASFKKSSEYDGIPLFTNTDEVPNNQLDDDCNGAVDDYYGVDTYQMTIAGTTTCSGDTPITSLGQSYYRAGHPVDNYGHGTFVTGLISSVVDNGGSVSPAFRVKIMPIAANVHFTNAFNSFSLVYAVNYAVANGADVINMSLGGTGSDPALESAINDAVSAGVLVVVASGNEGHVGNPTFYPAAYSNTMAVGAVNSDNQRSFYSSYGSWLDVVTYVGSGASAGNATWQNSLNCFDSGDCSAGNIDDGFSEQYGIGTSFASPQVAGLAALIKSIQPTLTPGEIRTMIKETATDILAIGFDTHTGSGVINYRAAVLAALNKGQPMYRFYNRQTGAHFYTKKVSERDKLLNNSAYSQFEYEGIVFYVADDDDSEAVPMYRFYNTITGAHFYTIKESEKEKVRTQPGFEQFHYEGEVFKVVTSDSEGATPVYRFYNIVTNSHFYTKKESEKNKVLTNPDLSSYQYEGVVYYVK